MTYYFFIEINAPNGLSGIEDYLVNCSFPIKTYFSNFNDKVILRWDGSDEYDLDMETSTEETMHASGSINRDLTTVFMWLDDLSTALKKANFPHAISFDDNSGDKVYHINYKK